MCKGNLQYLIGLKINQFNNKTNFFQNTLAKNQIYWKSVILKRNQGDFLINLSKIKMESKLLKNKLELRSQYMAMWVIELLNCKY